MTERLYYQDSYLREFPARVVEITNAGNTVYLDRTAFYPTSGGQPFDTGSIGGAAVLDVADDDDRIAHHLASPLAEGAVACSIDWLRRFDHMQQHSGQHLLSAVLSEHFGLHTVSFHLGAASSTIDVEGPNAGDFVRETEKYANGVVFENRPLTVEFQEAGEASGLRKASDRTGTLRIIVIEGLDRSACGGTHVRSTGEIGPILIRKLEKIRQTTRLEFLCGQRAVGRARADYDALLQVAQQFSAPLDDVPALVATQLEAARASGKALRKLELELAGYRGKELYEATTPGADGVRRVVQLRPEGSLEDLRALAQSFTAQPQAIFAAALETPPSLFLAVSADAGVDAGQVLKALLADAKGRGGGTSRLAQGSVPTAERLQELLNKLLEK
jgi:alanyl-tRNA synthetase